MVLYKSLEKRTKSFEINIASKKKVIDSRIFLGKALRNLFSQFFDLILNSGRKIYKEAFVFHNKILNDG